MTADLERAFGRVMLRFSSLEFVLVSAIWLIIDHSNAKVGMAVTAGENFRRVSESFGTLRQRGLATSTGSPSRQQTSPHALVSLRPAGTSWSTPPGYLPVPLRTEPVRSFRTL